MQFPGFAPGVMLSLAEQQDVQLAQTLKLIKEQEALVPNEAVVPKTQISNISHF